MSVKRLQSGRWQASTRDVNGKRLRQSFRTAKAAEKWERDMIDLRERGELPVAGNGTLREFVPEWEKTAYPALRENTRLGYEGALRKHILPALGDMKLRKIDQRTVQTWIAELGEKTNRRGDPLSARTVEFNFAVLSSIMNTAAQYGLCQPLVRAGRGGRAGVKLPKKTQRRVTPPTITQIERLCEVVDPRFGAAGIRVAGYCGLRQSEIFGMHPDAVDFDRHRIHVYRTVEHSTGAVVDLTKSGKDRMVPMSILVASAIEAHMSEYPHPEFVFHMNGRRFDSSHFHRDIWQPAKVAAELRDEITPHDLRDSAASIMIAAGWNAKRVQVALGHHSAAFTLDRYGHLFPGDEDPARLDLDSALERAIEAAKNAPGGSRTPTPSPAPDLESGASASSATGADEEATP